MRNLILASQSPRRIELLQYLEIPFEVIPADVDESIDTTLPVIEEIKRLAEKKASWVYQTHPESIVIGSDTVVTIDNQILGKPKDKEDACRMLHLLSNRTHEVITAVSIVSKEKTDTFASVSKVYFHALTKEEIKHYVENENPVDKAGAYAIQGKASLFIDKIDGDYYSIMGLPISMVNQHLKAFK